MDGKNRMTRQPCSKNGSLPLFQGSLVQRRQAQPQQPPLLLLLLVVLTLWNSSQWMAYADHAYPLGCSQQPPSFYDYENCPFPPTDIPIKSTKDYLLVRRLGAGKFSDVFEAVDVQLEKQFSVTTAKHKMYDQRKQYWERRPSSSSSSSSATIDPRTLVVLKCLKPVSERKIKRELLVLQHASKLPNCARLLAVVVPSEDSAATSNKQKKYSLQPMPSLVLEHAGIHSQFLCHNSNSNNSNNHTDDDFLTEDEIRYYLYHLLIALDALHSCGIMHRDVKPRNVLINRRPLLELTSYLTNDNSSPINKEFPNYVPFLQRRQQEEQTQQQTQQQFQPLMLIDLGLADFYLPNTKYNVRVASRHYKSPELLLGYEHYDYAIDLWGVGCILAGLLFRREPFFRGYVL